MRRPRPVPSTDQVTWLATMSHTRTRPGPANTRSTGNSPAIASSLSGVTLDAMIRRGTHFAICDMATRVFAGMAAEATGGNRDAVYQEMRASAIANSHFVPAGIVAVDTQGVARVLKRHKPKVKIVEGK